MSVRLISSKISPSSSRKNKIGWETYLALALVLSACSERSPVDSCTYLDAFEKEVEVEEFTSSKGHSDALKMISQGRIVFLGGYLETGPISLPLMDSEHEYPAREIEEIVDEFGLEKIEKVFPTKALNEIKSGDYLKADDGVVNDSQVERECYNLGVRSYVVEFNRTIIKELLKKK